MPNLKFDFSRHICAADQSLVNAPPLGGAPPPCSLTYLSMPARRDTEACRLPPRQPFYHSNISLSRQDKTRFFKFLTPQS